MVFFSANSACTSARGRLTWPSGPRVKTLTRKAPSSSLFGRCCLGNCAAADSAKPGLQGAASATLLLACRQNQKQCEACVERHCRSGDKGKQRACRVAPVGGVAKDTFAFEMIRAAGASFMLPVPALCLRPSGCLRPISQRFCTCDGMGIATERRAPERIHETLYASCIGRVQCAPWSKAAEQQVQQRVKSAQRYFFSPSL